MRPSAKIIADSVSPAGDRVTTMEVVLHRYVLAELNTHRAFSRNSASSRAIPFRRQVERVVNEPAVPLVWAREQRGMQGGDEIEAIDLAEDTWLKARDAALKHAEELHTLGVHKSVINRLLEPFLWHTVVITATEWGNFFTQRCSPLAQPEIRVAAEAMRDAYDASTPRTTDTARTFDDVGRMWHLPYITEDEDDTSWWTLARVSAARCARVSYLTHDGTRNVHADLELYQRLVSADPPHWSPLEHVCTPEPGVRTGNLRGWTQLRHLVW